MTVTITKGIATGRISAPPSKSMAHRYLICGAMSDNSTVKGLDFSKDISATLGCLEALGAKASVTGDTTKIGAIDFNKPPKSSLLDCNESGSTLRFLIPLCLLFDREICLTGSERLFERSLEIYEQICKAQGIYYLKEGNKLTLKGKLSSGKYEVGGNISSQFISGLIFALSQLEGDSEINLIGKVESSSYLSLTIKALADFGVRISRADEHTIYIKGNQKPKNTVISVEGDYSNAAFFEAFNLFGGNVMVKGLDKNSAQGDRVYAEIFKLLAKKNATVDISDCPDLAPIFMAVAAAKQGVTLTGTKRLKIKESDRGLAMKLELEKMGCKVDLFENEIIVHGGGIKPPTAPIFSHNDHRIVMAMSVLLSLTGGKIIGAEAVSKSLPNFFERLNAVGIKAEKEV